MIDRFTYKNGKKMRYGYTTGSCATATSKASAEILLSKRKIESVEIDTPKGWKLKLSVEDITVKSDYVITAIKKDSGDDPDVTNGILIYSKVKYIKSGIEIIGGIGVGVVTKKGLKVEVGNPAINPVPLQMIKKEVKKVMEKYNYKGGLSIEISIPEGEEKAKRTFNPRLGIKGGLSVIGTTGIVEPMSDDAFKDSLAIELKMIKSNKLVLVPGNYGRDYCLEHNIDKSLILKTSNFIGFMFEQVCVYDIEKVLFVGHIGKLIKVAGGIFHTHNRVADARLDILVSHLVRVDATNKQLRNILNMNTTEEAVEYIYSEKLEKVFDLIVESIKFRIQNYIFDQYQVEVILFSSKRGKLSETKNANEFLELLHE